MPLPNSGTSSSIRAGTLFDSPFGVKVRTDFDLVLAFKYYDGPEHGVALTREQRAIRISVLGESNSGRYRAFLFEVLPDEFGAKACELPEVVGARQQQYVTIVPNSPSAAWSKFSVEADEASAKAAFLAVGPGSIDWVRLSPLGRAEEESLRSINDARKAFRRANSIVKESAQGV